MPERKTKPEAISQKSKKTAKNTGSKSKTASLNSSPNNAAGTSGQNATQAGTGSGGGVTGGSGGNEKGYLKTNYEYIKKHIKKNLIYNAQAKRMGMQGTTTLTFVIQKNGQVNSITISQSSGHSLLDEAAVAAVKKSAPFPAPPESARIVVLVSFSLK